MRVLITGAGGFVGGHLVEHLLTQPDLTLHASVYLPPGQNPRLDGRPIVQHHTDLRNADAVQSVIAEVRPDWVVHLAAQASVPQSFQDPWRTLENNIHAQVNLLQAILNEDLRPRTLIVSSAEVYGAAGGRTEPLDETFPFAPTNPYSVSKATQDLLGQQYYLSYQLPVIRVRPFNHIGPHQSSGFVATDFASQIAAIEAGQREPVMYVGNLSAERDFTDVRDVVLAYGALLRRGHAGEAYNVSSGRGYSIQYLLDTLLSYSTATIDVRQDPARMRPSDVPRRVGDFGKLHAHTGWQPVIPFEQSLLDILNDWRQRMGLAPRASHQPGDE